MIMNFVEVKEFSFAYPECSRKVLDHANLKIEEGTLNVICGADAAKARCCAS